MTVIAIDIISDPVCAWCFIGKRTLDLAISLYRKTYPFGRHDTFTITWRPYYLNHHLFYTASGHSSVPKSDIRKIKLADFSPEKIAAGKNRVTQAGAAVGITFKPGGRVGSTRDVHRLLHLCQVKYGTEVDSEEVSVRDRLVEGVFEAYHECERDVSDREVLVEIAGKVGMEEEEVRVFLEGGEYEDLVDEEARGNRERFGRGVPTFFVGGERVDGAGDVGEFLEGFGKVKEREMKGREL